MISKLIPTSGPVKIQVNGAGFLRGKPMLDILVNDTGPYVFTKPGIIWIDNDGFRLRTEESEYLNQVFTQERARWSK